MPQTSHTQNRRIVYSLSFKAALDGGGWLTPGPGRFTPSTETPIPILQDAGWDSGSVWTGRANVHSPGYASRTVQPVSSRCAVNAVLAFSMTVGLGKAFFFFPQTEYVRKGGQNGPVNKRPTCIGTQWRSNPLYIYIHSVISLFNYGD